MILKLVALMIHIAIHGNTMYHRKKWSSPTPPPQLDSLSVHHKGQRLQRWGARWGRSEALSKKCCTPCHSPPQSNSQSPDTAETQHIITLFALTLSAHDLLHNCTMQMLAYTCRHKQTPHLFLLIFMVKCHSCIYVDIKKHRTYSYLSSWLTVTQYFKNSYFLITWKESGKEWAYIGECLVLTVLNIKANPTENLVPPATLSRTKMTEMLIREWQTSRPGEDRQQSMRKSYKQTKNSNNNTLFFFLNIDLFHISSHLILYLSTNTY